MHFHEDILSAIGNTPLVRLNKLVGPDDATVLVKCEFMNPGGSIKDRMARHILAKAAAEGQLAEGGTIVENTSGNTGMGVAMTAAVKGYKCVFTMPDKMSTEKVNRLKAMGAQVVVTPTNVPAEDPRSYYETAKRIHRETPGAFMLNQYHNPDNVEAHYRSTGPEVYEQTGGEFDYFVAGLGTGGTMSGAGKYLKEKMPAVKNVGVDPEGSVYAEYFRSKKLIDPHVYKVEGIGEDMLCAAMQFDVLDDVQTVNDQQAFTAARRLAREEGIFAGGSSGAAVHVAVELAKKVGKGKTIVVMLPDSGSIYISKFFSDEWMRDNGFVLETPREATVGDVVRSKSWTPVITATSGESLGEVVSRLRQNGISQLPVLDSESRAIGMLHEVDVLDALVEGRATKADPVDKVMQQLEGGISKDSPVGRLREIFAHDQVAVVMEGSRVTAILNKIDLIEYLAARAA